MDRTQLRCNSPENVYGKLWEVACNSEWYPKTRKMSTVEKVWTITMVFLINLTIVSCAVTCFKKWMHRREVAQAEEERLRHLEMTRELSVIIIISRIFHLLFNFVYFPLSQNA